MDSFNTFVHSINWAAPSWDLFILGLFAIGSILYGMSLGRDRVIVVLLSMYTALAVVTNAPVVRLLSQRLHIEQNPVLNIGFFLAVFLVLFFLISHSPLLRGLRAPERGAIWQSILFGMFEVGLLISIVLAFLPVESTQGLTFFIKQLFMSDRGRSFWLLAPVLIFGALSFRGHSSHPEA